MCVECIQCVAGRIFDGERACRLREELRIERRLIASGGRQRVRDRRLIFGRVNVCVADGWCGRVGERRRIRFDLVLPRRMRDAES